MPGIGICVACSRVVCDGCSTRQQGRNFCAECLSTLARDGDSERVEASGLVTRLGLGALTLLSTGVLAATAFAVGFFLYMIG